MPPTDAMPNSNVPAPAESPSAPDGSTPAASTSSISDAASNHASDTASAGADASHPPAGHATGSSAPEGTAPKYSDGVEGDAQGRTFNSGNGGNELASSSDEQGGQKHSDNSGGEDDSGSSSNDGLDPVHSREQSGDGWHRLDDVQTDPHYGEPLSAYWQSGEYPVPNDVNQSTFDLVDRPEEPYGHDSNGSALDKDEYDKRYNEVGPESQPWNSYPPNGGAVPGTRLSFDSVDAFIREYGPHLDRIGRPSGEYLAVMPDGVPSSFESRGLPVSSLELSYHSYQLTGRLPEGWTIEISEVAPAFGRDGGGMQVVVKDASGREVSVSILIGKVLK